MSTSAVLTTTDVGRRFPLPPSGSEGLRGLTPEAIVSRQQAARTIAFRQTGPTDRAVKMTRESRLGKAKGLRRFAAARGAHQRGDLRVMAILVDTNLLVRLANLGDSMHTTAFRAVLELHRQGEILHVTPQNLIEFHAVATRPVAANGLGQTFAEAEGHAAIFLSDFPLLADTAAIFPAWQTIVKTHGIVPWQAGPRCSPCHRRMSRPSRDASADLQHPSFRTDCRVVACRRLD